MVIELSRFSFFIPFLLYLLILLKAKQSIKPLHILGIYCIISIITEFSTLVFSFTFLYKYIYPLYSQLYFITITLFFQAIFNSSRLKISIRGFIVNLNYTKIIVGLAIIFFIVHDLIRSHEIRLSLMSVSLIHYVFILYSMMYFYYIYYYSMEKRKEGLAIKKLKFQSEEINVEKVTLKNINEYQLYIIGIAIYSFVTWLFFMINPFLTVDEAEIAQYINWFSNIAKNLLIAGGFFIFLFYPNKRTLFSPKESSDLSIN